MHTGGSNSPKDEQCEGEKSLHRFPREVADIPLSIHMDQLFHQIIPLKPIARTLGWLEKVSWGSKVQPCLLQGWSCA